MNMKNTENKITIGITTGDLNGIGPEIIFKTLSESEITDICTPVLYCGMKTVSYFKKQFHLDNLNLFKAKDIHNIHPGRVNIISLWEEELPIQPGKPDVALAKYSFLSLKAGVIDLKRGKIQALVTAPLNKSLIQQVQPDFIGHTEYLASADQKKPLMIMAGEKMKVALATIHLPLKDVAAHISVSSLTQTIQQFHDSLKKDFLIPRPKIAILGLNPHAGDNGMFGREEQEIILPAIASLKDLKLLIFGPYAADGLFGSDEFMKFDGIVAMYHDQGLAPFKLSERDTGVNFTAGLSFVRTSPAHGPAYDIAGKGIASPSSFRHALYLAKDIYYNRLKYEEMYKNPLKVSSIFSKDDEEMGNNE